jgi:hypothetical protein
LFPEHAGDQFGLCESAGGMGVGVLVIGQCGRVDGDLAFEPLE